MKPASNGLTCAERVDVPGEGEEGGLERILDVVLVSKNAAASGPDHRAVPPDQNLERGRVSVLGESPDQFGIRQKLALRRGESPDVRNQSRVGNRHLLVPASTVMIRF
jgi:hypothetical protein